jgi:hypothetical protein
MIGAFTTLLYGIAVFQIFLIVVAIYYAYRVTRLIGSFWAWSLLILTFVLTLGRNLLSLTLLLGLSEDQIVAQFNSLGTAAVWPGQILTIVTSVLLTISMYGIHQIFSRRATKSVKQVQSTPQMR